MKEKGLDKSSFIIQASASIKRALCLFPDEKQYF
jgi:hypothetical protein